MSILPVGTYTLTHPCATASFTMTSAGTISGNATILMCNAIPLRFALAPTMFQTSFTLQPTFGQNNINLTA